MPSASDKSKPRAPKKSSFRKPIRYFISSRRLFGTLVDSTEKPIGRYVYLTPKDQSILDDICREILLAAEEDDRMYVTVDLETRGLNPTLHRILLVSLCWNGRDAVVFPYEGMDLSLFSEVLEKVRVNNQNVKFDAKFLIHNLGIVPRIWFCTMTAAQLGWAGSFPNGVYSLKSLAQHLLLGVRLSKEVREEFVSDDFGSGIEIPESEADEDCQERFFGNFTADQIRYAALDSVVTHNLVYPIYKRLYNENLLEVWETRDLPLLEVFALSELQGFRCDVEALEKIYEDSLKKIERKEAVLKMRLARNPNLSPQFVRDFNTGSGPQVIRAMSAYGVKLQNTREEELFESALAVRDSGNREGFKILSKIVECRKLKSDTSKFAKKWLNEVLDPVDHRIRYTVMVNGAVTGRLSCKEPNLMATEQKYRRTILADEDHLLVSMDYSQFEIRALAAFSGERVFLESFQRRAEMLESVSKLAAEFGYDDPDSFVKAYEKKKVSPTGSDLQLLLDFAATDVHRQTGALVFDKTPYEVSSTERSLAKTLNYAILYGGQAKTIRATLAKEHIYYTMRQTEDIIKKYMSALPAVASFISQAHSLVRKDLCLTNWSGRKRYFVLPPKWRGLDAYRTQVAAMEREAVNFYPQSINADSTKLAAIRMQTYLDTEHPGYPKSRVMLPVHDELLSHIHRDILEECTAAKQKFLVEAGEELLRHRCPVEVSCAVGIRWEK